MHRRWIGAALCVGLALATAGSLSAQQAQTTIMTDEGAPTVQPPPRAKPPRQTQAAAPQLQTDPGLDQNDQLAPSQVNQPMPAAVPQPSGAAPARSASRPSRAAAANPDAPATNAATAKPAHTPHAHVVDCKGIFARNSSHLRLAMAFDSTNITFTEVDGGSGNKLMATVLYSKDPKQRLEVWWAKPASRSDTYLIVINGQSSWVAPAGLRLGLGLRELEKLNKKPFKLKGFDKSGVAAVSDWDGGALSVLPGGCKAGVSLRPDAKKHPAPDVSAFPAEHEFSSADPALRGVNPIVSEILVGY